ncbi:hypothetical protein BLNAU_5137 [Blattamonas nauphoetae]|uniref:Uncharacterized protein n=1 Tax=Blattamonas nauphoetae TaxID=2049346 RepID=A0ABQ9Y876_9EUKA|nr:hypothetical protein BLNAU_5137 [Blattamonas nauphoetae]
MKIVGNLFERCSLDVQLDLVKVNLISQLITSLNPQSLSFTEGVDIHTHLIRIITYSFWCTTPYHLTRLGIEDPSEQQAVHETVLKQVFAPSEQYIRHLCVNRHSIMAGDQSRHFLVLLISLLRISSYYQRTREFVLHMPVILTIPSCLASFENDSSIWNFLMHMNLIQLELNEQGGENHQMWNTVHRMLRMEGIEDAIDEKLGNDKTEFFGGRLVVDSITWNNQLGMNLPEQE